jgi:DNA modification methylase
MRQIKGNSFKDGTMPSRHRTDAQLRESLTGIDWNFVDYNPSERAPEIHGLHWYPAPFPPGLAGTLIEVLGAGGRFLDPFSGSAVGPIEAWLRGYTAFGIDVNPVAIRISRAKVALLRKASAAEGGLLCDEYTELRNAELSGIRRLKAEEACAAFAIDSDAIRWFAPDVIAELAVAKHWISTGAAAAAWGEVLPILVSSILHKRLSEFREVHYTYIVDRSKTTHRPTRSVDAFAEISRKIVGSFIQFDVARTRLERAGMMPSSSQPDPAFIMTTSEEGVRHVGGEIDLVVTSPPYFGMNDYVRSQYLTQLVFPSANFEEQLGLEIGARRSRRSMPRLNDYLAILERSFKEMGARMNNGGCLAIILGTSYSSSASVRPHLDALENAVRAAEMKMLWHSTRRVIYRKINNTPFREEHIWVLRKAE